MLFVALLIAYPWALLTVGTLAYLASLPFGWLSYRRYEQRSREGRVDATAAPAASPALAAPSSPVSASLTVASDDEDRPSRLN